MKKQLSWVVAAGFAALVLVLAPAIGGAAAKKAPADKSADKSGDKSGGSGAPPGVVVNKCGCYAKGNGCVCTNKKAKCECPGECEPVGCDEKRSKEMEKEVADAVKRSQEDEKKREQAEAKKLQDEENKQRQALEQENKAEGGDEPVADAPPADAEKPKKPAKKGAPKK
jgi:hypothetical protein